MKKTRSILCLVTIIFRFHVAAAQSIYEPRDSSKIKWSFSDFGTMWTFDSVPAERIQKEYGFSPSKEWLDEVRLSALQFANGCSASFVSEDGLIMTNHHCGRNWLPGLTPKGADYLRDGYYSDSLNGELKIPGAYADQLMAIVDVTAEVLDTSNIGKDNMEKILARDARIKELKRRYSGETGLSCEIVELYHGSKYSLYEYKRYKDLRLVMTPDFQIASTGWDWDNFTYPRYELDFMFFRAYENGKPVHCSHFFKWSGDGAKEGEPVYVIGRPGSTSRLKTVAELEYLRDKVYKFNLGFYNELYKVYYDLLQSNPDKHSELLNMIMGIGNARKSYAGRYMALSDEYIIAKKKSFENELISRVSSDPRLELKYGAIWKGIERSITELNKFIGEYTGLMTVERIKNPFTASALNAIKYANQMKLNPGDRESRYKPDSIGVTVENLFPKDFEPERDVKLLRAFVNFLVLALGEDHFITKELFEGKTGDDAVKYLLETSPVATKERFIKFLKETKPEEILNSRDPFIRLVQFSYQRRAELDARYKEVANTLDVFNRMLGEAVFKIYGNRIPPDATSTLRISAGRIEGYEYNGTIAPGKTTFYGIYDRWNSFGKKEYPWGLHPRWQKIPEGFDLSLPVGFASTNDIAGGNSGSPVLNSDKEIVGLIHDGNLESLAGEFIFLPEKNRAVATDSKGLTEVLKYYYNAGRLADELIKGKLAN
jgi:Peptidase S46